MNRPVIYVLDAMSGLTFIVSWIAAKDVLMVIGGLASLAALLNHGYDFYRKLKGKK